MNVLIFRYTSEKNYTYCILMINQLSFSKIGVTNPEDQKKILSTMEQMHLDKVDLDTQTPLNNIDSG